MNIAEQAHKKISQLRDQLTEQHISCGEIQEGNYHYFVVLESDNDSLKLQVYFGKKGVKIVLQGNKECDLYRDADAIINGNMQLFEPEKSTKEPDTYIGIDESGKGDFFGPLVIAGFFTNQDISYQLLDLEIKDSKKLTDTKILQLAGELKRLPNTAYEVIKIFPEKYNQLYDKFGNLNRLLAWGHAKVIENLVIKTGSKTAISDKFGNESLILNALQKEGKQVALIQETKAERYLAVAAASILARAGFVNWLKDAEKTHGVILPKGASGSVDKAAKTIVEKNGKSFLYHVAKLHFKNAQKMLQV